MDRLYQKVVKFRKFLDTHNVMTVEYQSQKEDILQELAALSKVNTTSILATREKAKLYKIYDTFLGPFAKIRFPKKERNVFEKPVMDFFHQSLHITPKRYFLSEPTAIYEEFVKGITLFATDTVVERPSYHRVNSCGHKSLTYIQKFQYQPTDNAVKKRQKHESLRLCIIERKIYDEIYKHILYQQNTGHLIEILNLERLYDDYTGKRILVEVSDYKDDVMPTKVLIRTYHKDYLLLIEIYKKRDDGTVDIEKYKSTNSFSKLQMQTSTQTYVPQSCKPKSA